MANFDFWQKYNKGLNAFSEEMILHNQKSRFNFIESNHYNHVRDLLAFCLIRQKLLVKNKTLKILDYGSNIATWSNIINRISMREIEVAIFDPSLKKNKLKEPSFDFLLSIYNDLSLIKSQSFHLTIFGSSIQYIDDFFQLFQKNKILQSNEILITHTPLSLEKTFKSNQNSSVHCSQVIHSFDQLSNLFNENGYECIFKSVLPITSIEVDKIDVSRTILANLLFAKR